MKHIGHVQLEDDARLLVCESTSLCISCEVTQETENEALARLFRRAADLIEKNELRPILNQITSTFDTEECVIHLYIGVEPLSKAQNSMSSKSESA